MKKVLSVCLALCLVFTLAAPALAETVSLAPAALEAAPVAGAPAAVTGEAGTPAMVGDADPATENEAAIGDVQYPTLKQAVLAASDGDVIRCLTEITLTKARRLTSISQAAC